MKNSKNKYIVWALLINLSLGFNAAEANFFDKVKEGSKKALEVSKEAAKKAAEASKVALEKAKEAAEATLEYTKEQMAEIEKERQDSQNQTQEKTPTQPKKDPVVVIEDRNEQSTDSKTKVIATGEYTTQDQKTADIIDHDEKEETKLDTVNLGGAFPWSTSRDMTPSLGSTTTNGIVVIEGNTRSSTRWVMLHITKGDSKQQILLEAQDGKFKTEHIGLLAGAGEYKVTIAESSADDRLQSYNVTGTRKITNLNERDMTFLLPSPEIQSTDPRIVELALDIAGHANTQREALELINEWIVTNLRYDWEGYRSGSYQTDAHDAVTIMEKRMAVCEGYSRLFAALARAAGIKTKFIHGKGYTGAQWGGHAWNEVLIDGKWLNVDSTWNNAMNPKKYFLIDNAQFMKDHKKENELNY